jgi:catechol 2,3-dioxygenase-like lactoylglutathione lyase family enzyme
VLGARLAIGGYLAAPGAASFGPRDGAPETARALSRAAGRSRPVLEVALTPVGAQAHHPGAWLAPVTHGTECVTMKVHRLGWLTSYTDRFDETRRFFAEVLGLPVEVDEPTFAQLAMSDADHDYIEVLSREDSDSAFQAQYYTTGPVTGFVVDDVIAARAELLAAGIEVLDEIQWSARREGYGWFHFRAPDGNVYGLMQGSHLRG